MSAQVYNHSHSAVGRMFARQNVPSIYGMQKSARQEAAAANAEEAVDKVSLSPMAPRPLSASYLSDALDASRIVGTGGKLSGDATEKLREDRIFNAMVALATIGGETNPDAMPRTWPSGLPPPSRDELEAARRRLTQRLRDVDQVENPEAVQRDRLALLEKIGKMDFTVLASGDGGVAAAAKASA